MTEQAGNGSVRDEANRGRAAAVPTVGGLGLGRGGPPPRGRLDVPPVVPDPYRYTMADLQEQTGLSPRTIRYYVSRGLIRSARGRGPSATYDLGHLLRLRMIQLLQANFVPLEEIKERLDALTDDEIAAMLEIETHPPEDRWRRVQLHPDVELHVRDGRGKALEQAVEIVIGMARSVLDRMEEGR